MAGETMKVASVWNRRNKILLRELVVTDFKLRYQGSVLGYLWSILKPIFLFIILYIVFDKFLYFFIAVSKLSVDFKKFFSS